ncbi:hypothetical protein [Glycomyces tarimensis]
MTTPSVEADAPSGQLIESWVQGWMRLEDLGDGQAIVVIVRRSGRLHVADVEYGDGTPSLPCWNSDGMDAIEQYKRNFWDSKIISAITRWLKEQP